MRIGELLVDFRWTIAAGLRVVQEITQPLPLHELRAGPSLVLQRANWQDLDVRSTAEACSVVLDVRNLQSLGGIPTQRLRVARRRLLERASDARYDKHACEGIVCRWAWLIGKPKTKPQVRRRSLSYAPEEYSKETHIALYQVP